jgi:succinate dehydrogenase / fumarate reductase cytochrome b subunit
VNKKRPINLDLMSMKFPPMAIASILHRISGIVLFLLLPLMLYLLQHSLHSAESFTKTHLLLAHPLYQLMLWAFGSALIYHVLAGIRHLVMDAGWGEHLPLGKYTALLVIVLSVILILVLGMWIW